MAADSSDDDIRVTWKRGMESIPHGAMVIWPKTKATKTHKSTNIGTAGMPDGNCDSAPSSGEESLRCQCRGYCGTTDVVCAACEQWNLWRNKAFSRYDPRCGKISDPKTRKTKPRLCSSCRHEWEAAKRDLTLP